MPVTAPINVFTIAGSPINARKDPQYHRLFTETEVFSILQRDVAILYLDCDASSRNLLVNSEFGQVLRFSLR